MGNQLKKKCVEKWLVLFPFVCFLSLFLNSSQLGRLDKVYADEHRATITVNENNFLDYFNRDGRNNNVNPPTTIIPNYSTSNGLILTTNDNNRAGNASLKYRMNLKQDFSLTGSVDLGDKFGASGGDGIGFVFHPNKLSQVGYSGANMGIGGLPDAIGFKLDTYNNIAASSSQDDVNKFGWEADPFSQGQPFGTFVTTSRFDSGDKKAGYVTRVTQGDGQPQEIRHRAYSANRRIVFNYNYDKNTNTGKIAITYYNNPAIILSLIPPSDPQTWTYTVDSDYIDRNPSVTFVVAASTGGAKNRQVFKLDSLFIFDAVKKLKVTKNWDDDNNQYSSRPKELNVTISGGGISRSATLNAANNWSVIEDNLPAFTQNGEEITYTVNEPTVPFGYTASYNQANATNPEEASIKNTLRKKSITITKKWEKDFTNYFGSRPTSLAINLYQSVEGQSNTPILYQTINLQSNQWSSVVNNLPEIDPKSGKAFVYTIDEPAIPNGYTKSSIDQSSYTITNSSKELYTNVYKKWLDGEDISSKRPSKISFTLSFLANDKQTVLKTYPGELNASNGWITGLPTPYYANGNQEVKYIKITEQPLSTEDQKNYRLASISPSNIIELKPYDSGVTPNNFTLTNVKIFTFPVTKVWDDNNQSGKRKEVTITLLKNGVEQTDKVLKLNSANGWKAEFKDLDQYDNNNKLINYTIKENAVDYYKQPVITGNMTNGYTVTNKLSLFDLVIQKNGLLNKGLKNAVFSLKDSSGKVINGSLTTDTNGRITQTNLAPDTYTLTEETAPEGYVKLAKPLTIQITPTGTVTVTDQNNLSTNTLTKNSEKNDVINLTVKNTLKGILPATGGHGKIAYMIAAGVVGIAFLATVGYYVFRNRREGVR